MRQHEHDARHLHEGHASIRMVEFDVVAQSRSVADLLRANLEDAEEQHRAAGRRARKAQKRYETLTLVVESWEELMADYERSTAAASLGRRN
jgi:hypothetical protein